MTLEVIQSGPYTTVQDLGRPGFRDRGVPVGGVYDRRSAMVANALLGNDFHDAVLELTTFGGMYEAKCDLGLAVAGARFRTEIFDGPRLIHECKVPSSFVLKLGQRLMIGGNGEAERCYLAVAGGWRTPLVLGSRSSEVRLIPGDQVESEPSLTRSRWTHSDLFPQDVEVKTIRVVLGPDFDSNVNLDGAEYLARPDSNRMGLRLEGPRINLTTAEERLSTPVAPGAVQIAGGLPIVLGVASGTIGGYPHVAQVISADLDSLAQIKGGQRLRFSTVTLGEARRIDRDDRETVKKRCLAIQTAARQTAND